MTVVTYNQPVSRLPSLRSIAVLGAVTYLCAAGWFLVLTPWSRIWAEAVVPRAPLFLMAWLDSPAVRGALSGFGVLHFIVAYVWLHTVTSRP